MAVGSLHRETERLVVTDDMEGSVTRRAGQLSAAGLAGGSASELRVRPDFDSGLLKEVFSSDSSVCGVEEHVAAGLEVGAGAVWGLEAGLRVEGLGVERG